MAHDMQEFSGTVEVAEAGRFDTAALFDYLRHHVDDLDADFTVEQFAGGQSNPTYRLRGRRRSYVMRTKPAPAASLLPSAHAIEREYRFQHALAATDVPVARMHVLCEDEAIIGRAFYLMEYVEGRIHWQQSLPGMAPRERGALYDEMNRVIAALHAVDFRAAGLGDLAREGNYLERQIRRWTQQYRASETEPIADMDRLIDWLPRHVPASSGSAIVHGDFRLDNLVFHPSQPRVLAVLDWELATIGDPVADLSYHCLGFHSEPGPMRGLAGLDLQALGIPDESAYRALYGSRTGRDVPMEHWPFYMAYNFFRIAAILQGVKKRAQEGIASNRRAHEVGDLAAARARQGWAVASGAPGHP